MALTLTRSEVRQLEAIPPSAFSALLRPDQDPKKQKKKKKEGNPYHDARGEFSSGGDGGGEGGKGVGDLNGTDKEYLATTLANDENSSDSELKAHFIRQGFSKSLASKVVSARGKFLKGEYKNSSDLMKHLGAGTESNRVIESAAVLTSKDAVVDPDNKQKLLKGPICKVVLITEGLGNMRDKNYYGPEAIESGARIFEGSVMMQDHLGFIEEQDIPEGRVGKTVAYYKNCKSEMVDTPEGKKLGITAEAHFDLSQEGLNAYQKAKTAVHYRDEFPATDREYVGISVNAIGESEPRIMNVNGQELEVNYVMRFAEGSRGADMVTLPARGGSFRALVEDIYGAQPTKEVQMKKLLEALEKAQASLKEAIAEKDAKVRQTKTLEAQKALEVSIKAIREAKLVPSGEGTQGGQTTIKSNMEDDVQHDPDNPDCECEACKPSAEGDAGADGAGDGDGKGGDGDDGVSSHVVKHTVTSKGKAAIAAAAKQESERRELMKSAVEKIIEESGIDKKYFDIPALCAMSFKEAKADIAKQKRMHEAAVATVLAKVGQGVSASHRARESGSGAGGNEGDAPNNAEFPLLSVAE